MKVEKTIIVVIPRDEDTEFLGAKLHHEIKHIFCRGWYWEIVLEADNEY